MELSKETLKRLMRSFLSTLKKGSAALMVIHLVQDELGSYQMSHALGLLISFLYNQLTLKNLLLFTLCCVKPLGVKRMLGCVEHYPVHFGVPTEHAKFLRIKLGVKEGHVREDGEYSIEFMECLADCGEGPVVMVGEETYENIEGKNAEKFAKLLVEKELNSSKEFSSYEEWL